MLSDRASEEAAQVHVEVYTYIGLANSCREINLRGFLHVLGLLSPTCEYSSSDSSMTGVCFVSFPTSLGSLRFAEYPSHPFGITTELLGKSQLTVTTG